MKKISIPPKLTELAYQNIKEAILQGKFAQQRFTEESLSFSLGISKSPIREALNALKNEGLIRIEPRRGVFLREFSLEEIRDLYGVREALEVYAVRHCDISPNLVDELERSVMRTESHLKDNNKKLHIEEDAWFHRRLAIAAGKRRIKSNAADNSESDLAHTHANVRSVVWHGTGRTPGKSSRRFASKIMLLLNAQ